MAGTKTPAPALSKGGVGSSTRWVCFFDATRLNSAAVTTTIFRVRTAGLFYAALLGMTGGCTELMLAPYRDEVLLDQHQYVLGEQYVEVDGLRLCYQEFGEGDAVIILPGLATSIDFWQLVVPELAKFRRVLALDPPGFGKSEKPDVSYDLPWIGDRVVAFMDAKGIDRASVIGGSMGGHVAMLIALDHPDRVDRLVLMGSSGTWREPGVLVAGALRWLWSDALVTDHLRRQWPHIFPKLCQNGGPVAERLFRYQMSVRADADRYRPEGRAASRALRSIFFNSCLSRLRELRLPVLLIWGEQDKVHLLSEAFALRDGLPDARLVLVPNAAHEVMIDQPETFNRLIQAFFQEAAQGISDRVVPEKHPSG